MYGSKISFMAEGRAEGNRTGRRPWVVFIDELHTMVGAGKAEGAIDAGNMLKPALARGELHCVGATTLDEYRKYIEKDAALERRFQKVLVDEPSVEATIAILRGLQEKYELHHGVDITDPAIVAAAELSSSVHHRPFPARQGDRPHRRSGRAHQDGNRFETRGDGPARPAADPAQDRARGGEEGDEASRKRLALLEDAIGDLEREYADLEEIWKAEKAQVQGAAHIKEEIEKARAEIVRLQREGKLDKVAELQYGKLPQLEAQLNQAEKAGEDKAKPRLLRTQVGAEERSRRSCRARPAFRSRR